MQDGQVNPLCIRFDDDVGTIIRRIGIDHPEQHALGLELIAQGLDRRNHLVDFGATVAREDQHDGLHIRVGQMIVKFARPSQVIDQTKVASGDRQRGVG